MADRTTTVSLRAQVGQYLEGMDKAARKTRELGTEAEKLAAKRQVFEDLGRPLLAFGAIAGAAVAIAVKRFAEFDESMSQVSAVTQESAANMMLLRDAALDAGGATVYTATEAANAIEELGKASLSTADILGSTGALNGALSLAASGQLEVARAAEITATTLKQYSLDGSEAAHVSDVLSAGAGKALGSVEDLAQGLKFVGPVAASMGISLEETTGALALFADQGIVGEQAGTALRGVLASLTSPSSEAAKEIDNLRINLYDANGSFIGLEGLAGKLGDAYQHMDDKSRDASLGLIFGNAQVTAARVLFKGGAEDIAAYTEKVDDAGYAARVAAARLDNLSGDVEKLGGSFDSNLIKNGSGANDVLRGMVQSATYLSDRFGELPQPVLNAGFAITAVAAAMALTSGTALVAVPKFAAFRAAMENTKIGARGAAVAVGGLGAAIGVATIAISLIVQAQAEAAQKAEAYADTLEAGNQRITKSTRDMAKQNLATEKTFLGIGNGSAYDAAEKLGVSLDDVTDAAIGNAAALERVQDALSVGAVGTKKYDDALKASGLSSTEYATAQLTLTDGIKGESKSLEDAIRLAKQKESADRDSGDSSESAAEKYQSAAAEVANLASEMSGLIDTINKANGVGQDAVSANAAYQQSLDDLRASIAEAKAGTEGYSTSIDESTAAGASNADMFADLAAKSQSAAEAQLALDGNVDGYLATVSAGRQTLYDQILALTGSADAAQVLTDKVYAIPTSASVEVLVETAEAQRRLDAINASLERFKSSGQNLSAYIKSGDRGYADGGYTGGGSKYETAGVVHRGEFVSTQETLAKPSNRAALDYMHAGGDMSNYVRSSSGGSGGGAITVLIQSKGGIDLTQYIDAQIVGADSSNSLTGIMGRQVR